MEQVLKNVGGSFYNKKFQIPNFYRLVEDGRLDF